MSRLRQLIGEVHRRSLWQVLATVRHRSVVACECCLALLTAVGCGRGEDPAYSRGSTVTVAYCCGPAAFNPSTEMPAKFLVFMPLVSSDEDGNLQGRLARRWEYSPDRREVTYHLRTDVRWHDGVPVTAHDIKFTLELLAHPDVQDLPPGYLEAVTVVDDSTVTVRSTRWSDEDELWRVYYPKHLLGDLDPKEFFDWEFWSHPVGSGPYRFVRYMPETMMEFEATPDYYRGKPRIERVVLKFVAGAELPELLSGNVDAATYIKSVQIPKLASDPRFRVYHEIAPGWAHAIWWQNEHPLFSDRHVRRALTLAINRRELLQVINLPDDIPVFDGPYTSRQLRRGELAEPLPHDPARAQALLDAAGWLDRDGDGVRERDGAEFKFTAIVPAQSASGYKEIALYVQGQLRRIGVRMEVQYLDGGLVNSRVMAGDFEAAFGNYGHEWMRRYFGQDYPLGYKNAEVVRLIDRLQATVHPDAKDRIYGELMEIFRADLPVTFLFSRAITHVVHRRIQGLRSPYRTDPVWYMEELWIEDER